MTVDVMLPYFSDASSAMHAIESVRSQTMADWRLVCVDDDYPGTQMEELLIALADPRIEYVRNAENLGLARNFNRCVDLVTADYFVMMGDDDRMHERYLESVLAKAIGHPAADAIQPGVRVIDAAGIAVNPLADRVKRILRPRVPGAGLTLSGERMAESLIRADWAYFPSIMWKSDTVRRLRFDARFPIALDLGLLLDIALSGGSMHVYDDVVFDYRRHGQSASSTTASSGRRFALEQEFFDAYADKLASTGWMRASRVGRRRVVSRLNAASEALGAMCAGDLDRARRLAGFVV